MWLTPHQFRNNKGYVFSKARENGIKTITTVFPHDGDLWHQPRKIYDVKTKRIINTFNMKTWEKFEPKDKYIPKGWRWNEQYPYFADPSTAVKLENHTRLPGRRTRRRRTIRRTSRQSRRVSTRANRRRSRQSRRRRKSVRFQLGGSG